MGKHFGLAWRMWTAAIGLMVVVGGCTIAAAANYVAGDGPYSVAAADLNADGRPDLVVANAGSDNVSVLFTTCLP